MRLISNDFTHQGQIPLESTCDGQDISPHLKWSDFPEKTKSFALSCMDPDAPSGNWTHWLLINIPVSTTELHSGMTSGTGVANDFGRNTYGGPCPPSGQHRYFFKVYALNVEALEEITKENFIQKVEEHVLDLAELMGVYQRQ